MYDVLQIYSRGEQKGSVRGELGFLPAYVDVIIAMFNYCKRLENLEKGCLLESIYRLCVNEDDCGTFTWYSGIKDLCLNTLGASVQHNV